MKQITSLAEIKQSLESREFTEHESDNIIKSIQTLTEEYNGWTNRETWAFMLHVDNTQSLQEEVKQFAKDGVANNLQAYAIGDMLKDWYEQCKYDVFAGEYQSSMNNSKGQAHPVVLMIQDVGSDWRIDWRACAQHLINAMKEGY